MVNFTVPGQPQGKQRARTVRRGGTSITYTPDKTVAYEAAVRKAYRAICGERRAVRDGAAVTVIIEAFYQIPKSASKATKELMIRGDIRPTTKPDWDNIGKMICDALNPSEKDEFIGAWQDDAKIASATVEKWYALHPRVDVYISEIQPKKG